jgi:AraC-like DNA-binding protein
MVVTLDERVLDSPYLESISHGHTLSDGSTIRPAESNWHMVLVREKGKMRLFFVGPLTTSGIASWQEGAEIIWIRFRLGTFMPHLPLKGFLDIETVLPGAASQSFWLKGSAWQFPDYENVDTFVERLVRDEVLVLDPLVAAALQDKPLAISDRTVRHRFLQATGLTQSHIRQNERAQQAAALLRKGVSILDTVYEAGYFDQPHLTRALKQWVGYTPGQLFQSSRLCDFVQERELQPQYAANVLEGVR